MVQAELVRRIAAGGALGSRPQAFSEEKIPFRASMLDEGGSLQTRPYGMKTGKKIRLLADRCLDARAGDGVYTGDDFYIVQAVNRWSAHIELICEAQA